jgi:hypothetical protein
MLSLGIEIGLFDEKEAVELSELAIEISKMLSGLIKTL